MKIRPALDEVKPLRRRAVGATVTYAKQLMHGKQSEVDGLIYQVVRLAEQYGVDVPEYRKIAEAVKKQTENK